MIDSHCHLADEAFAADLEAVVERARAAGLESALCILAAGDAREAAQADRLAAAWPEVRFAVGVHPHQAGTFADEPEAAVAVVRRDVEARGAVAVGEIGLDYHYDFAPRPCQVAVFRHQVRLARELGLPVVIHTREADADTFAALEAEGAGGASEDGRIPRGVFHCFTGDTAMARRALDLGFAISLSGIVTFPRAEQLREVARMVPADRLLVETDAPYLAPVPHRGSRNEPAWVRHTLDRVADVRGVAVADLAASTTAAFERLVAGEFENGENP